MKLVKQLSEISTKDYEGRDQIMAVLQEYGTDHVFCILSSYIEQEAGCIVSPYSGEGVILVDPKNDLGVVEIMPTHLRSDEFPFELVGCLVDVELNKTDLQYFPNLSHTFTGSITGIEFDTDKTVIVQVTDADDDCFELCLESIEIIYFPYMEAFKELFPSTLDPVIERAKSLWSELGDIPINEDDEIEEEFTAEGITFEEGTDRQHIWHWFEEHFNVHMHDLMYGNI